MLHWGALKHWGLKSTGTIRHGGPQTQGILKHWDPQAHRGAHKHTDPQHLDYLSPLVHSVDLATTYARISITKASGYSCVLFFFSLFFLLVMLLVSFFVERSQLDSGFMGSDDPREET